MDNLDIKLETALGNEAGARLTPYEVTIVMEWKRKAEKAQDGRRAASERNPEAR